MLMYVFCSSWAVLLSLLPVAAPFCCCFSKPAEGQPLERIKDILAKGSKGDAVAAK